MTTSASWWRRFPLHAEPRGIRVLRMPGVFRPHSDTRMLADRLLAAEPRGKRVLDLCTGSGYLAISAAAAGAQEVVAVDISRRSTVCAWLGARLNGTRVKTRRGDLLDAVTAERFDVIVSNPPYVPGRRRAARGAARAWEGGPDGREILDRICARAADFLNPGGRLLLIHSSICDSDRTLQMLNAAGLDAAVETRRTGPLGPIVAARASELRRHGRLGIESEEELVVIRATRGTEPADRGRTPT